MKQNKKPRDIFGELGKIFEDAAKPYPQFLTEKTAAPSSNTGEGLEITRGVWTVDLQVSPFLDNGHIIESNGVTIAHVEGWDNDEQDEAEANAKAICLSVNETIGKGYNPAAMGELVEALLPFVKLADAVLKDTLKTSGSPLYGYNDAVLYVKDLAAAKAALLKAKLNTVS